MLLNEEGKVIWKEDYTPFGTETGDIGDQSNHVKYTGKEIDEETGLYYFNARWYDQNTGRFTSEDPIRDGMNWYVYCGNNPLRFIDPTGLINLPFVNFHFIHNLLPALFKEKYSLKFKNIPLCFCA